MWKCKECGGEVRYAKITTEVSNISKSGKVFFDKSKIQKNIKIIFTCVKNPSHSSFSMENIAEWVE